MWISPYQIRRKDHLSPLGDQPPHGFGVADGRSLRTEVASIVVDALNYCNVILGRNIMNPNNKKIVITTCHQCAEQN